MIRIAVVDDENRICAQLESLLLAIAKENNLRFDVDVLYSGSALCEELKRGRVIAVNSLVRIANNENIIRLFFSSNCSEHSVSVVTEILSFINNNMSIPILCATVCKQLGTLIKKIKQEVRRTELLA